VYYLDIVRKKLAERLVTPDIHELVARMPKPVGSYGYDPWGYNEEAAKLAIASLRWLYEKYFKVTAHGLEHIPKTGPVLIVPNHSGQLPMDGLLTGYAVATNPDAPRAARAMIERFFPTVPWLGNLLNAFGAVIGDPVNCARMLDAGEAILVFPEGIRGSGKLYKHRYQLQRFGNGFMHLAMQHDTPVIPVGIVGCEETMPAVANIAPLAKLLGVPYIPVAPPVPLPARIYLNFGEPMRFTPARSEEEVTQQVEKVKDTIRMLIDRGLQERTSLF
jgi:1-acyl-sn-glycerol-3-phosphate acyltransferase